MTKISLIGIGMLAVGSVVAGQSLTASITPKAATATVIVASKTYDGTTAATVTTCTVQGILAGDVVVPSCTATFTTKQAGTAKAWTATITWSGADVGNYSLPTSANGTADILRKPLTLQLVALDKVYNALLDAALNPAAGLSGVIAPDVVCVDTSGLTAAFADKNVGVNKPVTVSGTPALGCADAANYTLGAPPPPPTGLLTQANLTYLGAFSLPIGQTEPNSFNYVGVVSGEAAGMAYWPAHNSLIISGNSLYGKTAEVSIPVPKTGAKSGLNRATLLQPFTDVLDGKRLTVDGGPANGAYIGGYAPTASALIVTVFNYYDGTPYQSLTHFKTVLNFANVSGNVTGPFQVNPTYANGGGFVSGWILPIPPSYQASLGGTALTGNGALSINGRTSWGPAATSFTPEDLGNVSIADGTRLIGYTGQHPTVGHYNSPPGDLYNGAVKYGGAAFPVGYRTVLFFGRTPTDPSNYCYGEVTHDPALERQPVPGTNGTVIYCYDPAASVGDKGTTGYPYTSRVVAYDVNDLIAVKQGLKQWWEPVPYASWTLSLPFGDDPIWNRSLNKYITGVGYDPATNRVFLLASYQDDARPIVHVFHVTP